MENEKQQLRTDDAVVEITDKGTIRIMVDNKWVALPARLWIYAVEKTYFQSAPTGYQLEVK